MTKCGGRESSALARLMVAILYKNIISFYWAESEFCHLLQSFTGKQVYSSKLDTFHFICYKLVRNNENEIQMFHQIFVSL